jgi:hypothetical protein
MNKIPSTTFQDIQMPINITGIKSASDKTSKMKASRDCTCPHKEKYFRSTGQQLGHNYLTAATIR